jgi:hypothetical protein
MVSLICSRGIDVCNSCSPKTTPFHEIDDQENPAGDLQHNPKRETADCAVELAVRGDGTIWA